METTSLPSFMQLEQTQPLSHIGIKYPQVSPPAHWTVFCLMQNCENHHIMWLSLTPLALVFIPLISRWLPPPPFPQNTHTHTHSQVWHHVTAATPSTDVRGEKRGGKLCTADNGSSRKRSAKQYSCPDAFFCFCSFFLLDRGYFQLRILSHIHGPDRYFWDNKCEPRLSSENLLQTGAMPEDPPVISKNDLSCPPHRTATDEGSPLRLWESWEEQKKKNCRTFQGQNGVFKEILAEHGADFVNK